MEVIILRGLPGSGKSTWIRAYNLTHRNKTEICSADHYFIGHDGIYRYDPTKAREAHTSCLRLFLCCLINHLNTGKGLGYLFVDNTNTTVAELAPYVRLAEVYEVPWRIIHVHCDFEIACQRNTHGVPRDTIWRMETNLREPLPFGWREEIVFQTEFMNALGEPVFLK